MIFYKIPSALENEIEKLENSIIGFKSGELNAEELKIQRVPFGIYEQRKNGSYMVRIRCNAGAITPTQFKKAAELSILYGKPSIHVTTRQEIQIHDVDIDGIIPIIRGLNEVGVSSRGGGGNTVRNIMASYDSGLFSDDVFDVTAYAFELANRLIADKSSWNLPRKYKISFSSKKNNNANAHVQDLGFIADVRDGVKGFKVYAAGGMGGGPEMGFLLHDFVPGEDIFIIAEAIKRVFSRYGNRKNKYKARLRWLLKDIGEKKLRELYNTELKKLGMDCNKLTFNENLFPNTSSLSTPAPSHKTNNTRAFKQWLGRYVKKQKQVGLYGISIPLLYGEIDSKGAVSLAELLEKLGGNTLRFTMGQNIFLRNIPERFLANIYEIAVKISELALKSPILGSFVTCTGADTCRLGICLPKGLYRAITNKLEQGRVALDKIGDIKIKISGCPNSCGQHMVADIGFYGKVGKNGQNSYPAYNIVAGARSFEGQERLAKTITDINARDLPEYLEELLFSFQSKGGKYSTFSDYVDDVGEKEMKELAEKYRNFPSFEEDKNYYFDWGATEIFSLAGRSYGECSAGLFDLIDFDLKQADSLIASYDTTIDASGEKIYRILIHVARALLITRGIEAPTEREVFNTFKKWFIDTGYVPKSYNPLISLGAEKDLDGLTNRFSEVRNLLNIIRNLYNSMDNSLQFPEDKTKNDKPESKIEENSPLTVHRTDLRGVACPMNFVKTKIVLSQIAQGEVLEVLLDDGKPIENVPGSVENEGHIILSQVRIKDHWKLIIKKV